MMSYIIKFDKTEQITLIELDITSLFYVFRELELADKLVISIKMNDHLLSSFKNKFAENIVEDYFLTAKITLNSSLKDNEIVILSKDSNDDIEVGDITEKENDLIIGYSVLNRFRSYN